MCTFLRGELSRTFGVEWAALPHADRDLVLADFEDLLRDEYDTPDDTMGDAIAMENAEEAAMVYRRRIGGGNLAAYVRCLAVHARPGT